MAAPATSLWLNDMPSAVDSNTPPLPSGMSIVKLTATADFDYVFVPEHSPWAMTLYGDGNDGAGTLSIQGSLDGTNFFALPAATSLTAAGVATVARNDLGFPFYRVHLTGSTNPTLTCYVAWWTAQS